MEKVRTKSVGEKGDESGAAVTADHDDGDDDVDPGVGEDGGVGDGQAVRHLGADERGCADGHGLTRSVLCRRRGRNTSLKCLLLEVISFSKMKFVPG